MSDEIDLHCRDDLEGGAAFAVAARVASLADGLIGDRHAATNTWLTSDAAAAKARAMIGRGLCGTLALE